MMTHPRFGDDAHKQDRENRAKRIRSSFKSGTTVAAHTEYCISEDYWTELEIRARATAALRDEVREALGALDESGLPFAGPTFLREGRAPVWRQRAFWDYDDYVYNFNEYRSRAGSNIAVANKIAAECRERNGRGPNNLRVAEVIEEDEPAL